MIHQARFSNGGPYPIHFGTCSECPSFGRQRKTASGALLKSFVGVRGIWLLRGHGCAGGNIRRPPNDSAQGALSGYRLLERWIDFRSDERRAPPQMDGGARALSVLRS